MAKNKKNRIIYGMAVALITVIVIVVSVMVSRQMKADKYYEQLKAARVYMQHLDYEHVVEAYKAAIEIDPSEADAYIELAEAYIDMGEYDQASYYVELGSLKTEDKQLIIISRMIEELKFEENGIRTDVDDLPVGPSEQEQNQNQEPVYIRFSVIENVADYCYQEYINAYGSATMSKASDGYVAKFQSFAGKAYFKNTSENANAVNEVTRQPEKSAKPYKVVITSPDLIFVGYEGYISNKRLSEIFDRELTVSYDSEKKAYFVEFEYMECRIRIETDEQGNVTEKPVLELYPLNLVKEDWIEEKETEETEEPVDTFTLGSHTYTYNVTSIMITGEYIEDLSPLKECSNLYELTLEGCTIGGGLDALAKCSSLVIIDLRESIGFSDVSPIGSLSSLMYLDLHGCSDVSDISSIMHLDLQLLHTCETGITYEQAQAYKDQHPECEVWYDSHTLE